VSSLVSSSLRPEQAKEIIAAGNRLTRLLKCLGVSYSQGRRYTRLNKTEVLYKYYNIDAPNSVVYYLNSDVPGSPGLFQLISAIMLAGTRIKMESGYYRGLGTGYNMNGAGIPQESLYVYTPIPN